MPYRTVKNYSVFVTLFLRGSELLHCLVSIVGIISMGKQNMSQLMQFQRCALKRWCYTFVDYFEKVSIEEPFCDNLQKYSILKIKMHTIGKVFIVILFSTYWFWNWFINWKVMTYFLQSLCITWLILFPHTDSNLYTKSHIVFKLCYSSFMIYLLYNIHSLSSSNV